jgi:hypothetical protein
MTGYRIDKSAFERWFYGAPPYSELPSLANATHILLQYELGNQISRQAVTVLSNGLVMHSKSHTGVLSYLPDQQLTDKEIQQLEKNIDLAGQSEPQRDDGIPAAEGGEYGSIMGYTANGFEVILYSLTSNDTAGMKTLLYQANESSDRIRELIQKVTASHPFLENQCAANFN